MTPAVQEPRPWYVVTPEYGEVVPILDDGTGPTEYGCDVVMVEAPTKRAAVLAGVKAMRANPRDYKYYRDCDGSPFTGVRAELAVCEHGKPHFVIRDGQPIYGECSACEQETAT